MDLTTRLFVGNLPDNFDEHVIKEAFSSYGNITNIDLKCKSDIENDNKKKFAFVTLSTSNFNVESCIKFFSNETFHGNRLYVTRARESFLQRLQRERELTQDQNTEKNEQEYKPYSKKNFNEQYNKLKNNNNNDSKCREDRFIKKSKLKPPLEKVSFAFNTESGNEKQKSGVLNDKHGSKHEQNKANDLFQNDERKQSSDKKRLESMKKKRQEFNEKKNIIKTGFKNIDHHVNKKIKFFDSEEEKCIIQKNASTNGYNITQKKYKPTLFEDGDTDDEVNFEIKNQYEGKKGQKVLDLQSRYKSDKRFILDERFIEESGSEKEEESLSDQKDVDLNQADEKSKQLNILQDVLGVTIKTKTDNTNKSKTKLGMLRFDPAQPEHAKYLVPISTQEIPNKSKKKKSAESKDEDKQVMAAVTEKVEVSKEQFYKISDSLKDTMEHPTTFSLRGLFTKDDNQEEDETEKDISYIPLQIKKDGKVKHPLDKGEKNPFVYDSSESENEEDIQKDVKNVPEISEIKTVWRENLFFTTTDHRLKDGLSFFGKPIENEGRKERRELKSLMKKRIYNKERKNTMFQRKIGGRKKSMRTKS